MELVPVGWPLSRTSIEQKRVFTNKFVLVDICMKFFVSYISNSNMENMIQALPERKYLSKSAKNFVLDIRKMMSRKINTNKKTGTSEDDMGGAGEPDESLATLHYWTCSKRFQR